MTAIFSISLLTLPEARFLASKETSHVRTVTIAYEKGQADGKPEKRRIERLQKANQERESQCSKHARNGDHPEKGQTQKEHQQSGKKRKRGKSKESPGTGGDSFAASKGEKRGKAVTQNCKESG
jgi:hypothetical protein